MSLVHSGSAITAPLAQAEFQPNPKHFKNTRSMPGVFCVFDCGADCFFGCDYEPEIPVIESARSICSQR